jgi:hypothetical protein
LKIGGDNKALAEVCENLQLAMCSKVPLSVSNQWSLRRLLRTYRKLRELSNGPKA